MIFSFKQDVFHVHLLHSRILYVRYTTGHSEAQIHIFVSFGLPTRLTFDLSDILISGNDLLPC